MGTWFNCAYLGAERPSRHTSKLPGVATFSAKIDTLLGLEWQVVLLGSNYAPFHHVAVAERVSSSFALFAAEQSEVRDDVAGVPQGVCKPHSS